MEQTPALRATRAYIDLDAIEGNVRAIKSQLPGTTQIMAVVKADAYGTDRRGWPVRLSRRAPPILAWRRLMKQQNFVTTGCRRRSWFSARSIVMRPSKRAGLGWTSPSEVTIFSRRS